MLAIEIIDNLFLILFMKGRRGDESCAGNNVEADDFLGKNPTVQFLIATKYARFLCFRTFVNAVC